MKLNRNEEFLKLMDIIKNLKEVIQLTKEDYKNEHYVNNEYLKLIDYIENEITKNEESIKEIKEPFLLFIVGGGNYGKSTLINTLLKEKLVETTDLPNTWKLDLFIKSSKEKIEITYQDNTKAIKSLREGTKTLKSEEEKYKVSRKKISRLLKEYKNTKELNISDLKEYKKKLEEEYLYKSNITQIKYYINKGNILDDFILVDTPGLNQTLLKNTLSRIKKYYEKADGVIWLIDAQNIVSKENNLMIEEIEYIDNLHIEKKNIIAVVNKIDIVKKGNIENLEKIKKKTREIYGDRFDDIVFISAKEALEGLINEDKCLIQKSNINCLYESIDENFKYVAEENQIKSKYKNLYIMKDNILKNIYNYKRNLYKDISIYNESKFEQKDKIKDLEIYLNNKIKELQNENYKTKKDIFELEKSIEELQELLNLNLEKVYKDIYCKPNFKPTEISRNINTKVYFTKSKNIVLDHKINIEVNTSNSSLTNIIEGILNKSNSKIISNEDLILINNTIPKINFLTKEIIEIVHEKLELIKNTLDEVREKSFREKHIDYSNIKKNIDYLDNIENIMKNLR